jgi:hypothetical protein
LSAVESSFKPVISVVRPAVAPESAPEAPAPSPAAVIFGAPSFVTASTATVASARILRHWFSPHALVLLRRDVMPGVHAIRVKVTGHAQTFALDFGRPMRTNGKPFHAGGWLRSDSTGVTVCIRALETYKHHTLRSSETCSVVHRNWHRVALRGRAVAKGHRLVVSVYELGASSGDSFDVGGFRVAN